MSLDPNRKAQVLFAAVVAAGLLTLAGWRLVDASEYETYQIETADPVSGLVVDAPVEFHGVDVGRVKQVALVGPQKVRVLLLVNRNAPVNASTVATITSRGLATRGFTGYVYISLENAGQDARPVVAKGDAGFPMIPTTPSRMVNLDLAIDEVNRNVELLTQQFEAVLDPRTIASIKQSADNLSHVSKALESQVLPQAQKTLTRLDELSSSMSGAAEKVKRDPSVVVRGERRKPGPGE